MKKRRLLQMLICISVNLFGNTVNDIHTISPLVNRTAEKTDQGILVKYDFDLSGIPKVNTLHGALSFSFDGFGSMQEPGFPAVPTKCDRFFIPHKDGYTLTLIDSSFVEFSGEIIPSFFPTPNTYSFSSKREEFSYINPYDGLYPSAAINTNLYAYRSGGILDVCVNPVRYDYHLKTVRVYSKLYYLLKYEGQLDYNSKGNEYIFFDPILKRTISYAMKDTISKSAKSTSNTNAPPSYLIITVPKYINAVEKLVDWKKTIGFDVKVDSRISWDTISVKDAVEFWSNPDTIDYLLIVGDFEDVPGKIVKDTITTTEGVKYYSFSTDYYYGCIAQDVYPEIRRGRLPVSTINEAENVIEKIIQYEKEPITDPNFYKTGVNCAYFEDRNNDSIEDERYVLTSEVLRNFLVNEQEKIVNRVYNANDSVSPYYWNNKYYGYYNSLVQIPSELLRTNNYLWDGQSVQIRNYINEGAFYVFHRDHGLYDSWYRPSFSLTDINALTNDQKLPVVFSINCHTGRYNGTTCFAEAFLRKNSGGCVAIFAASETSFSGFNDALAIGMFDAIWPAHGFFKSFPHSYTITLSNEPSYRLGDILDIGLTEIPTIYEYANNSIVLRHTKEIFHCFGDPSMEIYTDTPTHFKNIKVYYYNNIVSVWVPEGGTITFYNTLTNEIRRYSGQFAITTNNDNLRICISGHNKIPRIIEGNTFYIQNETIADSVVYQADTIKVGANVTQLKAIGDARFSGGHITLKGNSVELLNGTIIEAGTEVEINKQE